MNFVPMPEKKQSVRFTGAVYTPDTVAIAVSELVATLVPKANVRVLEPSVGDGAFLTALAKVMPSGQYTAVDIDDAVITRLRATPDMAAEVVGLQSGDFVEYACDRIAADSDRFGLIVGNPPFIRRHNFSLAFKEAVDRLAVLTEYPGNSLKNSWVAFLIASSRLVASDGVVAFILPYELMTVTYGQRALLYLLTVFDRIDLFVSNERAFPEIDQDAIVFVGRVQSDAEPGLFLQHVPSLSKMMEAREHKVEVGVPEDLSLELNRFLLPPAAMETFRRLRSTTARVEDFCQSSPGVVTAANDFFIVTSEMAERAGLHQFGLPIIKRGSLRGSLPVFGASDFLELSAREPSVLLKISDPKEMLPEAALNYLAMGEAQKLNERYKCRHRTPWYDVPLVEPAEGFVFRRTHEFPRLCMNEAGVYVTDNAYGIRPKPGRSIRGICFSFYNSLTFLFSETDGRFYGGGVLELSPSEFRKLPMAYHEPTDDEFEAFLETHRQANGDADRILDFGDGWLGRSLKLSAEELIEIRKAWRAVRSHRLRHGRPKSASAAGLDQA